MRKWKQQKEQGDQKKIAEKSQISEVTISNAFRTGKADIKTVKAINDFYKEKPELKKQELKELLSEIE